MLDRLGTGRPGYRGIADASDAAENVRCKHSRTYSCVELRGGRLPSRSALTVVPCNHSAANVQR